MMTLEEVPEYRREVLEATPHDWYAAIPRAQGKKIVWEIALPTIFDRDESEVLLLSTVQPVEGTIGVLPMAFENRQAAEDLVVALNLGRHSRHISSP